MTGLIIFSHGVEQPHLCHGRYIGTLPVPVCWAWWIPIAAAFEPLSRAYAIPKEDPSRGEVMERCLRDAAAAPMEILRLCCEAIDLHSEMLDKGSVMVLSDVGTGAVLCWGALYGAWLNVKVNTKSMADRPYAEAMNDEADGLVEQYWKRAEQIYESVMGRYT